MRDLAVCTKLEACLKVQLRRPPSLRMWHARGRYGPYVMLGGFPAPLDSDGNRAAPFWSSEARARRVIKKLEAYKGFEIQAIELDVWRERWLPGLARDGFLVGVNWSGERATGFDIDPADALENLAHAVAAEEREF